MLKEVTIRETDVEIMVTTQDTREEQITRREAEAASASVALTAREEQAAKWEAELAARERALAALADQVKRGQTEAPATSDIPTSGVAERANVKLMMQDILRQARRSVRVAGLGRVNMGEKGMDQETIGYLALSFEEISRCLKALPRAMQELASREGRALGPGSSRARPCLLP